MINIFIIVVSYKVLFSMCSETDHPW